VATDNHFPLPNMKPEIKPASIKTYSLLVMRKLKSPMATIEGVIADMGDKTLSEIVHHFEEVECGEISIPPISELESPSSVKDTEGAKYVEQLIFFDGAKGETEVRYRVNKTDGVVFIEDILIA